MDDKHKPKTDFKPEKKLSKKDAHQQIKDLRKGIRFHNKQYYQKNKPVVSDETYDKLMSRLQELEDAYPEYRTKNSPSRTVGAEPVESLKKVKHRAVMLSLNAVQEKDKTEKFVNDVDKQTGTDNTFILEPKFDGLSVEIIYQNKSFKQGSTRGDGKTGEDITHNLNVIKALPKTLKGRSVPDSVAVRGEVLLPKKGFQQINKTRMEHGQDGFANPRNAAAGMVRQLDPKNVAGDKLQIRFYDILSISNGRPDTHHDTIKLFKKWGLPVDRHIKQIKEKKQIARYHKNMADQRDDLPYEIDGIVIKVDDLQNREKLGQRSRSPNWALAWKFKPRQEITTLEDIVVQVGRTGMLTPVALLQPVSVGGVTVSRATLHTEEEVREKDVRPGDKVRVVRAGDVIPEVVKRIGGHRKKSSKKFHMPDSCPSCGTRVYREGAYYFCPAGLSCEAQLVGRIIHYADRDAMNIDHLGDKTVKALVRRDMVRDVADLYELTVEDIKHLPGFSDRSARQLHQSIQNSREVPADRFVYALGIRHVGRHIARVLMQRFHTFDDLHGADRKDLLAISEIGPEIADSIVHFFKSRHNKRSIKRLFKAGITCRPLKTRQHKAFAGKTFVFTGSLDHLTRSEAKDLVERLGGKASSSVSGQTDILVAGENPGSKLDQAREHNVQIIKPRQFLKMVPE
ncbi:MAG: NAD-dependent DNA ligase LigA [Candidatus Omnitrophota bacterium]